MANPLSGVATPFGLAMLGSRPMQFLRRLVLLTIVVALVWPLSSLADELGHPVDLSKLQNCTVNGDFWFGNAQDTFQLLAWVRRGICVRQADDIKCYSALNYVLGEGLNEIRKAEYAGAAGVLALLPTIGALLGTPTNEIWRLLTMVPFGGALAMAVSFGGAILPVKAQDYESDFMKTKINRKISRNRGKRLNSNYDLTRQASDEDYPSRVGLLMEQVQKRFSSRELRRIPVDYIWFGLIGMALLLMGAHAAMFIVEQGALLPWWCGSRWWIHLWYMMVITTAIVDNFVQLPFVSQWTVILSDIPYEVEVEGGDDIASSLATVNANEEEDGEPDTQQKREAKEVKSIGLALQQLETLQPASISILGSKHHTNPYNTLFVMVSIIEKNPTRLKIFLRACSQLSSIGVFITGTAMFASAQLLSIAMATFALTLVLAAGVFGRTIAGWIVTGIEQVEPMIHFVAEDSQEAHAVIRELLLFRPADPGNGGDFPFGHRKLQVEIGGHIFVDQRRVAQRSKVARLTLGIIAPVYDLAKGTMSKGYGAQRPLSKPSMSTHQAPISSQPLYAPSYQTNATWDNTQR